MGTSKYGNEISHVQADVEKIVSDSVAGARQKLEVFPKKT
jgi:hypothetical protein